MPTFTAEETMPDGTRLTISSTGWMDPGQSVRRHNRLLPRNFKVLASGPAYPYDLELLVDCTTGEPRCVELTFRSKEGGAPITTAGLRVRLQPIIRFAAGRMILVERGRAGEDVQFSELNRDEYRREIRERRPFTQDRVEQAADAYHRARAAGSRSPTLDAASEVHESRTNFSRLLRQAREQGLVDNAPANKPPTTRRGKSR